MVSGYYFIYVEIVYGNKHRLFKYINDGVILIYQYNEIRENKIEKLIRAEL